MFTITHLIDDTAIGGINRALKDQTESMRHAFKISQLTINPRRPLAPKIDDDLAIIHFTCSWSKLPFLTMLRAQRARKPILIVEHTYTEGFEKHCVPNPSRFRSMLRLCYGLADKVVAVSHGQAQWMLSAKLVSPEKLVVIQQSVQCDKLLSLSLPQREPGAPLRIAAYGRYCEQKGFDTLIQAMKILPPELATLSLGGYGECRADLEALAYQMPNVHIGSTISNLPSFLSGVDVVVMPSRWEAFGIVCLEARAAGRPLVVADVDGLPEQINSLMGISVPPNDHVRLAEAIKAATEWNLTEMGSSARASVGDHDDQYVQIYGRLWENLIQNTSEMPSKKVA
jgi:glycosyltransferase involved in cell wall biosynthesis